MNADWFIINPQLGILQVREMTTHEVAFLNTQERQNIVLTQ